jgi:hypothetical protein
VLYLYYKEEWDTTEGVKMTKTEATEAYWSHLKTAEQAAEKGMRFIAKQEVRLAARIAAKYSL